MLISYALLIFALTSAVLAPTPPPQQPLFGLAWQTLQGNDLLEDGPDCPVHCWYRLKIAEPGVKPIWPDDANLDDFMCFDDPVSRVTYLKLQRVEKNDQFHLHTYKAMRKSGVNDLDIPLDGYWGRGPPTNDLNTSSDGKVRRVITFDEVAEIRTNGRERQVRFLKYEHVAESPAEYYSALTVYELTKEWQVLQGNEDPRLLEAKYPTDPPVLYPWYRLKPGDKPVWPNDENLDQIMEFIPTNGRVERASRLRLRRATTRDQLKLLLRRTGYDRVRGGHLNDPIMPLVGFWGRAKGFNNLPEGTVGPVVDFDKVMEIKDSRSGKELKREIRFLNHEEKKSRTFYSALTVYDLLPASHYDKNKKSQRPRDERPTKQRKIQARPE